MPIQNSHIPYVIAVVVTYQPELEVLDQLLNALDAQVESVVIIDNGSKVDLQIWINQRQGNAVEVVLVGENRGIASAQNVGIEWAMNKGAEFVLLMDQDSVPWPDMVKKLSFGLAQGDRQFENSTIAAGPISIDSRTGNRSFFVTEKNGIPRRSWVKSESLTNTICEVSSLISSGKLINLKLLKIVGGMRSNYFIDHVDTEWCFRAKSHGYVLIGVNNAFMNHTLGDKVKNIWIFGWRHIAYHSPLRDYYMFRNTILMTHDIKLTILWRIHLLLRLVKFSFYFLIFTPNRLERFNYMSLGIYHGILGISGKLLVKTKKCIQVNKTSLDPN